MSGFGATSNWFNKSILLRGTAAADLIRGRAGDDELYGEGEIGRAHV